MSHVNLPPQGANGPTNDLPVAQIRFPTHDDWLSREELDALTPEVLLQRLRDLRPLIADHALEAEQLRRPVDAVWNALRKTGAFYHFVPRRFGGLEFDVSTFLDSTEIVAEACASTGWVFAICVEHNWGLAMYPEEAQREIFGQFPYVIAPGVASPPGQAARVPGGYRVDGHWKWGSGVMHSDWIKANVMEKSEDGTVVPLQVVFPSEEATVLDVWHMEGMSGTGSNDIVVRDLFVPEHRVLNLADWEAGRSSGALVHDNPMYRIPQISFLSLVGVATAIGAARGALAHFTDWQRARSGFGTDQKMIDKSSIQVRLARASTLIDAAELVMRGTVDQMMELAADAAGDDFERRARIRAQNNQAMELCRDGVRLLYEGGGSSAHHRDSPLQRVMRDVNVMTSHVLYDWDASSELLGRAMLGYPANLPLW